MVKQEIFSPVAPSLIPRYAFLKRATIWIGFTPEGGRRFYKNWRSTRETHDDNGFDLAYDSPQELPHLKLVVGTCGLHFQGSAVGSLEGLEDVGDGVRRRGGFTYLPLWASILIGC